MDNSMTNNIPQNSFQASVALFPSSYKPTPRICDGAEGEAPRQFLPVEEKAMMFFAWCKESGKRGRIDTSDVDLKVLGAVAWVLVTAVVYIDGEVVSKATAGQGVTIGNMDEMDRGIQMASGIAKSRALTNAGFGVVSGIDVDPDLPGSMPAENYTAPVNAPMPDAAPAGPATMNPPQVNPEQPQANPEQPQADPVAAAKAVVCTVNGRYKGMTLGEVLLQSPRNIVYLAETYPQEGALKDAAKLLVPEAKRRMGQ